MFAYQGVRNVSFSENFMYALNGWFLIQTLCLLSLSCVIVIMVHFQKTNTHLKLELLRIFPNSKTLPQLAK